MAVKKFKISRKIGYNLVGNLRLLRSALDGYQKKHWAPFFRVNKSLHIVPLIQVAKIKSLDYMYKKVQKAFFFVNNDKRWNTFVEKAKKNNTSFYILWCSQIEVALWHAQFSRSISESRYLINHGFVKINNVKVKSSFYILKPGDVVHISRDPYIFTIKSPNVIKKLPAHLEVSFSAKLFIFAWKPQDECSYFSILRNI